MGTRPTIGIFCKNLADNSFGRAYILARVLARNYRVHVVGPQFGPSVWPPMAGLLEQHGIRLTAVPATEAYPDFLRTATKLLRATRADLVYALKPWPSSLGIGLVYAGQLRVPLVLDIDDWEPAYFQATPVRRLLREGIADLGLANSYLWLRLIQGQIGRARAITVSSNRLKGLYGGVIIPHGRDTAAMAPGLFDTAQLRSQWGMPGSVVLFLGTPRKHKGLEDLIVAMGLLNRSDVECLIVGTRPEDPYTGELRALAGERVRLLPMVAFEQMPGLIAAADIVVIPQRRTAFGEAQLPAKLFDAMAMARPIVATAVSDLPDILDGCGLIVPPEDPAALARALADLLDHPDKARQLGNAARAKCVRQYSWDAMEPALGDVIEGALGRPYDRPAASGDADPGSGAT